ncbi:hypothetical protein NC797_13330 [Aquibacillus sp. 3ASR75-11]|uniref:Uncharacterized protein n=1 Tax=Terrihalobacillus insolitus TaxID=2950438 RepID=A0A9X4AN53_9BACI|nr:hypothetical protein [Terrihalobacillus insolitus]MDC3415278.1 hypothetical protein [Terrihalobacillus insolitus]MDC3425484.1 hypothetical protein [Terrihalobacillus insolitus]
MFQYCIENHIKIKTHGFIVNGFGFGVKNAKKTVLIEPLFSKQAVPKSPEAEEINAQSASVNRKENQQVTIDKFIRQEKSFITQFPRFPIIAGRNGFLSEKLIYHCMNTFNVLPKEVSLFKRVKGVAQR